MIKSILRPRIIFASLGALIVGGLVYFSYFSYSGEIYINQSANANSSWTGVLNQFKTNSISENLSPAQNLGEQPNLTDALLGALTNTLGPRIMQENGLSSISPSDINAAAQYLPKADAILPPPIALTTSDLKISDTNDAKEVKKYFNSVMSVYEKTFFTLKEDEFTVIGKALENGNTNDIQKISTITEAFRKSFDGVKALPVPMGWENVAIQELKYLHRSMQMNEVIQNSGDDLMKMLIILTEREKIMLDINRFHKDLGQNLRSKGIILIESDKAYDLLY